MDDSSENETTTESSTDRRRKLSIVLDRPADLEYVHIYGSIENTSPVSYTDADVCIHDNSKVDNCSNVPADNVSADNKSVENTGWKNESISADDGEKGILSDRHKLECAHADKYDSANGFAENNNINPSTGSTTETLTENNAPGSESDKNFEQIQDCLSQTNIPAESDTKINKSSNIADIVYDETKPKRLPNRKRMQLDLPVHSDESQDSSNEVLRSSIDVLISPDDPDSPGKRRGRSQVRDMDYHPVQYSENVSSELDVSPSHQQQMQTDSTDVTNENHHHYEKSPKMKRRERVRKITNPYLTGPLESHRSPSPVERRIVTKHETPASSTVHKTRRKSSSDAGPASPSDRLKLPPPRKVSLGATYQDATGSDVPKKRKVSFGTMAVYNGSAIMPLNDSATAVNEMPEYCADSNEECHGETHTEQIGSNLPSFVLNISDDDSNDEALVKYDSSHIKRMPTSENLNDNCFVNTAYESDGGNHRIDTTVSSGYHEYDSIAYRGVTPTLINSRLNGHSGSAVIPHSELPCRSPPGLQKISTASLPPGIGYKNGSYSSLEPKSILKNKKDDAESIASEDSIAGKKFKVRRDSIALFAGQTGDLSMQALVEQRSSLWRCPDKDYIKQMWVNRRHLYEKYKLHIVVLALFIFTFSFVIVGLHFHDEELAIAKRIIFDAKSRRLSLADQHENDKVWSTLGLNIPSWQQPTHCHSNYAEIDDKTCLKWKGYAKLDIAHYVVNSTTCYNVTWRLQEGQVPHDCFDLGSSFWYGPTNTSDSQWPITTSNFTFTVSHSKHHGSGTFSSAVEYYWLSSNGEAIVLDSNFPLEINWNTNKKGQVCVTGKESGDFYYTKEPQSHRFSYHICNGIDIHETHMMIRRKFFPAVTQLPERWLIDEPHWSSVWDSETFRINESLVVGLAEDIQAYGLSCSTIDIDGKWESMYGDLEFNKHLFSNVSSVLESASRAGCKASLYVYPFFHFKSINFPHGLSHGYFVKDIGKTVPALVKWQHGVAAMVDISNPQARDWMESKLRKLLQENSIDAIRLSYGTASWIPHNPVFYVDSMDPNTLKHMFSDTFSSLGQLITQSTSQSQHLTGLIAVTSSIIQKKDTFCLKNIIPEILNLGLLGYPFVMSDGFSVDEKFENTDYVLPSRDLYIRWMQLSAFLPAMKYTVKPWVYDEEVIKYAQNISTLHKTVVAQSIYDTANSILSGEPIIAPIWWMDPQNKATFDINDQFLINKKYLVAPILCESRSDNDEAFRDIYIPKGIWRDLSSSGQDVILGGKWLNNYKTGQFDIPVFVKLSEYGKQNV